MQIMMNMKTATGNAGGKGQGARKPHLRLELRKRARMPDLGGVLAAESALRRRTDASECGHGTGELLFIVKAENLRRGAPFASMVNRD